MTILRTLAPAALLAVLAIGAPGPAAAAPGNSGAMSGEYDAVFTADGSSNTVEYFFNPCGNGCENVDVTRPGIPLGLQAHLVGGVWKIHNPHDSAACPDGKKPSPGIFSTDAVWDPNSLHGTARHTLNVPACGLPAGASLDEQTLSFRHI